MHIRTGSSFPRILTECWTWRRRAAIAEHLRACASCRATADGLRETKSLLRAMPPPPRPGPEFWTDVYRRLRVDDRERASPRRPLWDFLRGPGQAAHRRWAAGAGRRRRRGSAARQAAHGHPSSDDAHADVLRLCDAQQDVSPDVSALVESHTDSVSQLAAGRPRPAEDDRRGCPAGAGRPGGGSLCRRRVLSAAGPPAGPRCCSSPRFLPGGVHAHLMARVPSPRHRTARRASAPPKPSVPSAADLFVRVLRADDLFTYQGRQITIYWTTGRNTAVEVYHQPAGLPPHLLPGPRSQRGRLLVSDGRQQWQYDPRRSEVRHRLSRPVPWMMMTF